MSLAATHSFLVTDYYVEKSYVETLASVKGWTEKWLKNGWMGGWMVGCIERMITGEREKSYMHA